MFQQEELGSLLSVAVDLIKNDSKLEQIAETLEAMDRSNSKSEIADDLERLSVSIGKGRKETQKKFVMQKTNPLGLRRVHLIGISGAGMLPLSICRDYASGHPTTGWHSPGMSISDHWKA